MAKKMTSNKIEKKIEKSKGLFKTFADSSKSAIFIIQDEYFIYTNQAMQDITGYSETELLSMKFWDTVHPDMKEIAKNKGFVRQKEEKTVARYDIHLRHKSGESRWVDYTGEDFVFDGKVSIFGTAFEITEKKLTQDALIESEARYRDIIDNMEDGYYEVDLAGNLTFVNNAMTRITGYTNQELLGMNNRDYSAPETAKRMYHIYNMIYKTGKSSRIFDYEIIQKDNTIRILEISASLVKNIQEMPTGFRGVVRDKTNITKAEKEKKELEKQLNQVLRMEAIGTLAGGIAHDFNNILTGIHGYISILKLKLGLEKEHPNYQKLLRIDELVQSGANLTRQLLGFAMGGKYHVEPININIIIAKSLNMIGRTNKKIRINKQLQEDTWAIEADASQIEQVMLNLYLNAAHAMPEGGDLSIETENAFVDSNSAVHLNLAPGKYVKIIVSDTGVGMNQKILDKIFEPFFTTKEMGRGTGLGLASAYGIIKHHNGKIGAESSKDKGATFTIYLPASNKTAVSKEQDETKLMTGSETILLIDDEKTVRQVEEEFISEIGYKVITASSGKEAVNIYKAQKDEIDIVVLDMIMPEMGGEKTFQALKRINPDVKVLLASGYGITDQATRILEQGNGEYIQKPFGMKSLSQKLRKVLDKRR
ncbi:MAG: PAS domain S-box protein [Deltaproteobacteria bacterium]|nr:PAS domain S-box protein [Deltaproteobacteria bacterium]